MKIIQSESNIGLIRKNNEDVALALTHPKDETLHLLLVADGMGGKELGEYSSDYTAKTIEKWFKTKSPKTLNNLEKVEDLIYDLIEKISKDIIKKLGTNISGTTLTMAIVAKDATLIVNVGDSRCYIYKNKKLIQVTEDDSDVWYFYKYGVVQKDDLRYFYNNNIITACVGLSDEICNISTKIIDNDYDILLLLTDGVTDLITDKKIKKLIDSSHKKNILPKIINEAVNVDQRLRVPLRLKRKKLSKYILPFPGRDNASGAILVK